MSLGSNCIEIVQEVHRRVPVHATGGGGSVGRGGRGGGFMVFTQDEPTVRVSGWGGVFQAATTGGAGAEPGAAGEVWFDGMNVSGLW